MNSEQQELLAQFCGITGASPSSAQPALTSADWDLEAAVSLYYAAAEDSQQAEEEPVDRSAASQPTPSQQAAPSAQSSSRRPPQSGSRLRTLRDLQASANDDDDDEEKDQDMFAGGEKSGLAVQNPGSAGPADHFRNILNQARQNQTRPPPSQGEDETPQRQSNFHGRAQTLGGDEAPSRVIDDPLSGRSVRRAPLERISRTLHLWADGVSVDDGPLFRFDDPANAHIMQQINRGQAPVSLLDVQPDQEVDLTLEPHKDQNYVQPKKQYKAFSGAGQRLGSPTPGPNPTVASSSQASTPTTATASAPSVKIDDSIPTLTLQVRLGDGTRLSSRFNTTHTIHDVYSFVDNASPQSTQRSYSLMTTFPTRELTDRSLVLGDMSEFKRGGVVVQKWT